MGVTPLQRFRGRTGRSAFCSSQILSATRWKATSTVSCASHLAWRHWAGVFASNSIAQHDLYARFNRREPACVSERPTEIRDDTRAKGTRERACQRSEKSLAEAQLCQGFRDRKLIEVICARCQPCFYPPMRGSSLSWFGQCAVSMKMHRDLRPDSICVCGPVANGRHRAWEHLGWILT